MSVLKSFKCVSSVQCLRHFFLGLLIFFSGVTAASNQKDINIDIYRTNQISLEKLKGQVGNQLKEISDIIALSEDLNSNVKGEMAKKLMEDVISKIQAMGEFSFVRVSPVLYPNDKVVYFTVDVVDKKDASRLSHFLPKPNKDIKDASQLIQKWQDYEDVGFSFVWKEKKFLEYKRCPAHHCIFGFDHPDLKKYKDIFNISVPKHKHTLITILRQDKDPQRRASAAYLLAHLKEGGEVINALSPSIFDIDGNVRNNVMRVLGAIAANEPDKHDQFSIEKIVTALDFPIETDRNKALYIMESLVENPKHADYVRKHAAFMLIDHLKLAQPNLHVPSFNILKKISKKNFSRHHYKQWTRWAEQVVQKN